MFWCYKCYKCSSWYSSCYLFTIIICVNNQYLNKDCIILNVCTLIYVCCRPVSCFLFEQDVARERGEAIKIAINAETAQMQISQLQISGGFCDGLRGYQISALCTYPVAPNLNSNQQISHLRPRQACESGDSNAVFSDLFQTSTVFLTSKLFFSSHQTQSQLPLPSISPAIWTGRDLEVNQSTNLPPKRFFDQRGGYSMNTIHSAAAVFTLIL